MIKKLINSFLSKFNYKIERKENNPGKKINLSLADGYPRYVEEAGKLNMDVNDYEDNNFGWVKPLPVLEEVLFPYLEKLKEPKLMELGPGTGRWSRHILNNAKDRNCQEYFLIDHSEWMINFLSLYFKDEGIIKLQKNNGISLPVNDSEFDVVFSQGVFVALKPAYHYLYSREFYRVLKPGGVCIFDYFNCQNEEGWKYFIAESEKKNLWYTYYNDDFIDKLFESAGFKFEKRFEYGKSRFVVYKK